MAEQEKVSLADIVNYNPEQHLSTEEQMLLQSIFKANPKLSNILRKVFLPSVGDPALPIEDMLKDVWLTGREWSQVPADEAKILMVARQEAIKLVMNGLVKMKVMAAAPELTREAKELKNQTNSAK